MDLILYEAFPFKTFTYLTTHFNLITKLHCGDHHSTMKLNLYFTILTTAVLLFLYCYICDRFRSRLDRILIGDYVAWTHLELEVYPLVSGICLLSLYFLHLLYFESDYNGSGVSVHQYLDDYVDLNNRNHQHQHYTINKRTLNFTTITTMLNDLLIHQQCCLFHNPNHYYQHHQRQQQTQLLVLQNGNNNYNDDNNNVYIYLQEYTMLWIHFFQIFFISIG